MSKRPSDRAGQTREKIPAAAMTAMAMTLLSASLAQAGLYDNALVHYTFDAFGDGNVLTDSGSAHIDLTTYGTAGAPGPAAIVSGARPWTGNGITIPDLDGLPNSDGGAFLAPVTLGSDAALNTTRDTPFSLATWAQRSSTSNGFFIASKQQSGGDFKGWVFQISRTGILQAIFRNQNTAAERIIVSSVNPISDTQWHHLGLSFQYNETDATRDVRMYVDGVAVDVTATATNLGMAGADRDLSNTVPFTISGRNGSQVDDGGQLDEFAIWKSSLSASDFASFVTAPVTVKQWAGTGSGLWSNASNWSPAGAPAATDRISFGSAISGDALVTIDSGGAVAGTEVNTAHKYTVALSGPTAFKAGELNIAAGTLALASGKTNTLRANSLTIAGSGATLDLSNNSMILDYAGTSPIAAVRDHLAAGRIIDSTATVGRRLAYIEASQLLGASGGTFGGESVTGNAVLLKEAYAGDANVSGVVNFEDLVALAQNYGTAANATWSRGDFDYNGAVDFTDLVALAQNYSKNETASLAGLSPDFLADWALAQSLVPEPGSFAVISGLMAVCGRRRK